MTMKGQKRFFQSDKGEGATRTNHQIRVSKVRVIRDGVNLGVMDTYAALELAGKFDLDLVEVASQATPPVCSIMDYGKHRYEQEKRKKVKKFTAQKEKEVKFRYMIADHDLEVKVNQIKKFLKKGSKVKITVTFKAREKAHKDQGFSIVKKCVKLIGEAAIVEFGPKFAGHNIICRLTPAKESEQ